MTNTRKKPTFKKNYYEELAWQKNRTVCGIDEVGRGCLAGPLVTAAVVLPPYKKHKLLKDSKILTEIEREEAYTWITKHCYWGVGILNNRLIDSHNIWQTTLLAMKKALVNTMIQLPEHPEAILVDAMPLKISDTGYAHIPIFNFIKGETKSSSIAAASIVAKVTRDRLMKSIEPIFPGYGFIHHKGYSTVTHKSAIREFGHTIIHRNSFLSNTLADNDTHDSDEQQSLC